MEILNQILSNPGRVTQITQPCEEILSDFLNLSDFHFSFAGFTRLDYTRKFKTFYQLNTTKDLLPVLRALCQLESQRTKVLVLSLVEEVDYNLARAVRVGAVFGQYSVLIVCPIGIDWHDDVEGRFIVRNGCLHDVSGFT